MNRYVLCYQDTKDPSEKEENALLKALDGVEVIDRIPGAVLVKATDKQLSAVLSKFTKWIATPSRSVGIASTGKVSS